MSSTSHGRDTGILVVTGRGQNVLATLASTSSGFGLQSLRNFKLARTFVVEDRGYKTNNKENDPGVYVAQAVFW